MSFNLAARSGFIKRRDSYGRLFMLDYEPNIAETFKAIIVLAPLAFYVTSQLYHECCGYMLISLHCHDEE
jgi:hypothetical protein